MNTARRFLGILMFLSLPGIASAQPQPAQPSSCIACHAGLDGDAAAPATSWPRDVHAAAGLGCESCHGGDPSPALKEDSDAAMDPKKGFLPAPDRLHVPDFCARCHSDAAYIKQFNPQARVDQLTEYRTSVHGRKNAAGDSTPATCIDCHGAHGVLPVGSPESPVYATRVPETCARCHSDAKLMAPYGIPTDQYDLYRHSVHAAALLDRGDTAAPACNDCHGNHGATPPGVASIANVCGQCHGREATLFGASFKKDLFAALEVSDCTACHDNHRILHPTPELFHSGSAPEVSSGTVKNFEPFAADFGDLAAGDKVTATWVVVLRPRLKADDPRFAHTIEIAAEGSQPLVIDSTLRPGDSPSASLPLGAKSDALVATITLEPLSGEPVEAGDAIRIQAEISSASPDVLRALTLRDMPSDGIDSVRGSACLRCHAPGDECDKATGKMHDAVVALDKDLRSAAGILHTAEYAGMEVGGPLFELKSKGTSAAVESRALIHSFDPDRLVKRTDEGRKISSDALAAGRAALDELDFRKKGLFVFLGLVCLVLAALYMKIRQVSQQRSGPADRA